MGDDTRDDLQNLGWDQLVDLKRRISAELKELSTTMVEIDGNTLQSLQTEIRRTRSTLDESNENVRKNREEIEKGNAALLQLSDKISQSKNFLSLIHSRLPSESEEQLVREIEVCQSALGEKRFNSEREKVELLSRSRDVTMKLEAIRATKTVNDQLIVLNREASSLRDSINQMTRDKESAHGKIANLNSELDRLYDSKRKASSQRDTVLSSYTETLKRFESVNSRLDAMSEMRRRQREEYGYALPNDALFKVKESARRKLESGSKLTFEELKLLYEDKAD